MNNESEQNINEKELYLAIYFKAEKKQYKNFKVNISLPFTQNFISQRRIVVKIRHCVILAKKYR